MPLERTSWRIANFDRILLSWRVYELEFYDNEDAAEFNKNGVEQQ